MDPQEVVGGSPNCPLLKDYDGPCRESAKTMLLHMIENKRTELRGLEQLLKVAEKCENGSPLEETLYQLLCAMR